MRNSVFILPLIFLYSFSFAAWDKVNNSLERYGDIAQIILPVSAAAYSFYEKDYKGTLHFTEAFAAGQSLTLLIKQTNEERPGETETGASFPSGHTFSAFAAVAFLDRRYDIKTKYYFYGAASLVGISRVAAMKHFIHDVLAGALIGIYANKLLVPKLKEKKVFISLYYDKGNIYALSRIKF